MLANFKIVRKPTKLLGKPSFVVKIRGTEMLLCVNRI